MFVIVSLAVVAGVLAIGTIGLFGRSAPAGAPASSARPRTPSPRAGTAAPPARQVRPAVRVLPPPPPRTGPASPSPARPGPRPRPVPRAAASRRAGVVVPDPVAPRPVAPGRVAPRSIAPPDAPDPAAVLLARARLPVDPSPAGKRRDQPR
ncbi:hypothetical protein Acit_07155 [Aciditerrimonas ferrireducens]|nr:hypothetical protein [Aciditerrimonas ferrireducens]